jgi:diguanylate cyclase (GGDEF)-like protein
LSGIVVAALTVAVATVGLAELGAQDSQAATLVARGTARGLLATAQLDVGESQIQVDLTTSGQESAGARAAMPKAIAQEQSGIDDWHRYKILARQWGPLPPGTAQLDRDLVRLQAASNPTPSSLSPTSGTPIFSAQHLATLSALAEQVDVDFSLIRSGEQAWWTAYLARHRAGTARSIQWLLAMAGLALIVTVVANGVLARAARRRDSELAERDTDLERVAAANEFEARLQRALELSSTEDRVFQVVEQALDEAVPDLSVEMLLADSSKAHFQQLVTTGSDHRCSVGSPAECPAAQRGEVLIFGSSLALDACPYLAQQSDPCSAVCVPVSVSGMTIGVVHAAGPHRDPPGPERRAALELVARRASDRVGLMRAFSRSEVQASTDSLTGLPNRRSLEDDVRRLVLAGTPYAVAFGDLDHFKMVNDVHGHGAGDQALRVFARVLRVALRPGDLFGRYGGEEFVVVLPNCDEAEAVKVLERIREQLAVTIIEAGCPSFTVSFGLACAHSGQRFETMVSSADAALLEAKARGRNRVVVAHERDPDQGSAGAGSTKLGTESQEANEAPPSAEPPPTPPDVRSPTT